MQYSPHIRNTPTRWKMARQAHGEGRAYKVCPKFFLFIYLYYLSTFLVNPHLIPSPTTWHTLTCPPAVHLLLPLTPNTSSGMCFRVQQLWPHPSCWTSKTRPHGHVFDVRLLLHLAPHTGHEKHALRGVFFVSGVFSTLSLTLNT